MQLHLQIKTAKKIVIGMKNNSPPLMSLQRSLPFSSFDCNSNVEALWDKSFARLSSWFNCSSRIITFWTFVFMISTTASTFSFISSSPWHVSGSLPFEEQQGTWNWAASSKSWFLDSFVLINKLVHKHLNDKNKCYTVVLTSLVIGKMERHWQD